MQNAEGRIRNSRHKCSSPKGWYYPHGRLAGPAPLLRHPSTVQPKVAPAGQTIRESPLNCCIVSHLRLPPRSAPIAPPYHYRSNAVGRRGPHTLPVPSLCPDGRPPSLASVNTPTSVNSGAAASGDFGVRISDLGL